MTLPNEVHKKDPSALKHISEQMESTAPDSFGGQVALTSAFSSGYLEELDEKCTSLLEKTPGKNSHGQTLYRCKVCGKEEIMGNIKRHIERNHLEGVSIPCNICGKTFRSRNSLAEHIRRNHKDCKDNRYSSSIF